MRFFNQHKSHIRVRSGFLNAGLSAVAAVFMAGFMAGCGSLAIQGRAGEALTGDAITREFPGHTLIGGIRNEAGAWATYVRADGVSLFRTPQGEILETQWAVTGDRFCYADVGGLDKICFRVLRRAPGYQFVDATGKESVYAVKRVPGDSLDLAGFLNSQRILRVRRQEEKNQRAIRNARTAG